MKITTSTLSRLITGCLLVLATPVLADTYETRFSNCDVVNVGPERWKATFTLNVRFQSSSVANTTDNTFTVWMPQLNPITGLPKFLYADRVLNPGWSRNSVVAPNGVNAFVGASLIEYTSNWVGGSTVIVNSGNFSIEFSTSGLNAYPAIFMRYKNLINGAGNSSVPMFILPGLSGVCYSNSIPPDVVIPPIDELVPPEPEFNLKSAVWELNPVEVGNLPDVATAGNGFEATIKNIGSNNLCLSYVTAGIKNKTYALSVTNGSSNYSGRNLFAMSGSAGSQLPYNLQLISNDGATSKNFDFPISTAKYISLSQLASSVDKRSEMCWTPKVNLFKTDVTKEGMHSDTINFIITPKA